MDMSTSIDYDNLLANNLANVAGFFNNGAHIVFSALFISDVDEEDHNYGQMDGGSDYVESYTVANQYLIAVEEKDGEYIFYTCRHKICGDIKLRVIDRYYNVKIESLYSFMSHYGCYDYPSAFIDHLSKSNLSDLKEKLNSVRMEAELRHLIPTDFHLKGTEPNFLHEILKSDWRFLEESLSKIINIVGEYAPSQFAYVDEKGNNILMTYCTEVNSWDKDLVPADIQTIFDLMPHSTFAVNNDQKTALDLVKENFAQLRKKDFNFHIVDYIENLFKV